MGETRGYRTVDNNLNLGMCQCSPMEARAAKRLANKEKAAEEKARKELR